MEEKELRKIITQKIVEAKSVQEEEAAIGGFVTAAFEEGRITEAEYYNLLVQYQIIEKLEAIETNIGLLSLK